LPRLLARLGGHLDGVRVRAGDAQGAVEVPARGDGRGAARLEDDPPGDGDGGAERERRLAVLGDRHRLDVGDGEVAAVVGRHQHGGEVELGRIAVAQTDHALEPGPAVLRRRALRRRPARALAHAGREEDQCQMTAHRKIHTARVNFPPLVTAWYSGFTDASGLKGSSATTTRNMCDPTLAPLHQVLVGRIVVRSIVPVRGLLVTATSVSGPRGAWS